MSKNLGYQIAKNCTKILTNNEKILQDCANKKQINLHKNFGNDVKCEQI